MIHQLAGDGFNQQKRTAGTDQVRHGSAAGGGISIRKTR
jgi:hypothetical protein